MDQLKSSLSENLNLVNPESLGEFPNSSSLVLYGQTVARNSRSASPWSRKQMRGYQRLNSWITEAWGRGLELKRVDLTSSPSSEKEKIRVHFQELKRRAQRRFKVEIEYFVIETDEGFGVLHMVWGTARPCYIPQRWLSAEWLEIHGAHRVWIKPLGKGKGDLKRVSRYLVSQYLAGQCKYERMSWSWWKSKVAIVKCWSALKRFIRDRVSFRGKDGVLLDVPYDYRFLKREIIWAWEELLIKGCCVLGDSFFSTEGRLILARVFGDAEVYKLGGKSQREILRDSLRASLKGCL
jgi:hypothetical protein